MERDVPLGSASDFWTEPQEAEDAKAHIRDQFLRLDSDERVIFMRILRQAERLDAALVDLHLVLPAIEICFYGISKQGEAPHSFSPRTLRKLMKRWASTSLSQCISRNDP
jgi:hypothetical protein